MTPGEPIADVSAVPDDSTLLFRMVQEETGETAEAVLLRDGADVLAWRNCCQHQRHVRLDSGDGALLRGGEIVCTRHGAAFGIADGTCTAGPCVGATLESVEVAVRDGTVVLVDEEWQFLALGGGVEETDRSTTTVPGF